MSGSGESGPCFGGRIGNCSVIGFRSDCVIDFDLSNGGTDSNIFVIIEELHDFIGRLVLELFPKSPDQAWILVTEMF